MVFLCDKTETFTLRIALHNIKRKGKKEFTETVLAFFHRQRTRTLWMHPRTQIWFEMVDDTYNDELWYANFRVTKETFTFILRKVEPEIAHENTHLREAVSAKRRLAVTLYYLASTAEYRTIGNLFGVSRSFVCQCIKEVCHAIAKQFPNHQMLSASLRVMTFCESFEVMKRHEAFPCVRAQ